MKKFLIGLVVLIAVAIGAFCTLDIGTGYITQKGAEYIAQTYNVGVSIKSSSGNPVKGYTFSDIELTRDDKSLIKAGEVTVDPALMKLITGNIAVDWIEVNDVNATIPNLLELAELFTGQSITLPIALPLNEFAINKIGGVIDNGIAKCNADIVLNGLPISGDFEVSFADGLSISRGDLALCGGTLGVTGSVSPSLGLKANASKLSVNDLATVVPQISDFAVNGLLSGDISISGSTANPTVTGDVSFNDGSVMGFPLSASATVAMEDMKANILPLSVKALGIPASGKIYANLAEQTPTIDVDIKSDGAVSANVLKANLPSVKVDLGGQIDSFSVSIAGPINALSGTALVKAEKITVAEQDITGTSFKAAFDSKGLVNFSGGSNIVGNPATLSGTVNAGGKEVSTDVVFSIDNFDLATLPKLVPSVPNDIKGKVKAALTVKGSGSSITMGGKLNSSRVTLNNTNIDKISVPFTLKGNTITLKDAAFTAMDLHVTKLNSSVNIGGSSTNDKGQGTDNIKGNVNVVLNGVPVKGNFDVSLANGLSISRGDLTLCGGTLSITGNVSSSLNVKAKASKLSVDKLSALIPQISSYAVKGLLSADLTISGDTANPAVAGNVSIANGSTMGFPLSASAKVAFKDMKADISPLSIKALGIPASGKVSANLSGKTPNINVNIKSDGAVSAKTLKDNLPSVKVNLGGQIDAFSVSLAGPVNALSGNILFKADKLTIDGQSITGTSIKANLNSKGLIDFSGNSSIAGNPATLKGTVNTSGKEVITDAALSVKNFDLSTLPKIVSSAPENIKGKVDASLTVKGTGSAIAASGKLASSQMSLNDMNVEKISVPFTFKENVLTFKDAAFTFMDLPVSKVNGSLTLGSNNIAFKEMSASVANGQIKLNSVFKLGGKNVNGNYDLKITSIDLANVMKTFGAGNLGASGKFSGEIKGVISDADITGNGSISIPSFTMNGLKFESIKSTVKLSKMIATLSNVSAKFAGGTIGGSSSIDINKMTYSVKATLKGSQLKSVITQLAPKLGGGLTGTLTGNYSASGKLNPFSLSGSGTVSSAGGSLYGFDSYKSIINIIAKLHGNKGVTYANAKIPFATDLNKLTLKDGSVINAESGDGIYKYIKATGTFAFSGALNMDISSSLNAMLVNTAASTLSGAVSAGSAASMLSSSGIASVLTGAKKGASSSYGKSDFRTLSFHVGGTVDNPKLSNFKENGKTWKASSSSSSSSNAVTNITEKLTGKSSKSSKSSSGKSSSKSNVQKQLLNLLIK